MKKILVIAVGLMSLLGVLSSCDDKSEFIETEEFVPYCYLVKDATTIQIVGYKSLVIEEKEKTDWQLFVPFSLDFLGNKPLELEETEFELFDYMEKNSAQIDVSTNMTDKPFEQDISFAVGGLLQSYTYMGEEQKLECFSPLMVKLEVVVDSLNAIESSFYQDGKVIFSLMAKDTICLVQKSVPFTVTPSIQK